LEEEIARMKKNQERRLHRKNAKIVKEGGTPMQLNRPLKPDTTRRCGHCGQMGHMSKFSLPVLRVKLTIMPRNEPQMPSLGRIQHRCGSRWPSPTTAWYQLVCKYPSYKPTTTDVGCSVQQGDKLRLPRCRSQSTGYESAHDCDG
jgi:hypothetical protein